MAKPGLPQGYSLISLDETDSTNDEAKAHAVAGAVDGTVVWARTQNAGRGRQGRVWVSPPGNLYVSVVLRPSCDARAVAQLSFVAALAAADLVDSALAGLARCKWPNDILVDGNKVAGILLESALGRAPVVDWVVLGIGVNLAHHPGLGPPRPSTSLSAAGAPPIEPAEALERILGALARWRTMWEGQGFPAIREAWLTRAHGLGGPIRVSSGKKQFVGTFEGLDADGSLMLLEGGGARRRIAAGDVFFGDAGTAHAARD